MRIFVNIVATIVIALCTVIMCYGSYKSHDYSMGTKPLDEYVKPVMIEMPEPEIIIPEVPIIRYAYYYSPSIEEQELLKKIAMAEASGEGAEGMALVMRVVINRSLNSGDTIKETIYSPGQFHTPGMNQIPSEKCEEAMQMIIDGWDESQGATYFNGGGYRRGKEALFQYGGHYFSK